MSQNRSKVNALSLSVLDFPPGTTIGVSEWITLDQKIISQFGEITRDPDPMHIDPEWARENGPYGGTIAFGFLTISFLSFMLHNAVGSSPIVSARQPGHYLNYGFDRLRLITPVTVGARIRGNFEVRDSRIDERGRLFTTFHSIVEIEGQTRPALVADWLTLWVPIGG